jgi:hypothetical protein
VPLDGALEELSLGSKAKVAEQKGELERELVTATLQAQAEIHRLRVADFWKSELLSR